VKTLILLSLAPLLCCAAAPYGAIEIAVDSVRSARGRVHVDICTRASFLKDCPYSGEAPARNGTTIVVVPNVPPGRYAAQAFHDKNGNGKVDRGLFGIPKEGVGFSNNALKMSEPKFDVAAFDHDNHDQKIAFQLKYFFS
jgi:uncharacterized protein (DUF2141 family)